MSYNTDEATARMRFVYAHAKLTVWIRQRSDDQWEAIDWYGRVLYFSKYRADVEGAINQMAAQKHNNIYAVATITEPGRRRPFRVKPTRRSL